MATGSQETFAEIVEESAQDMREELNIGLDDRPELVMESEIEDITNRTKSSSVAHYSPRHGKIVIGENPDRLPEEIGAQELEHARQAFRYAGFEGIVDGIDESLEKSGLIKPNSKHDFLTGPDTELLLDLKELGYSPDSLASLISRNPELSEQLKETSEKYPDNNKSFHRLFEKNFQIEPGESSDIEYSEKRLEYLMDAIVEIENQAPENGVMRNNDELIIAEKEGFAHFLGTYIVTAEKDTEGRFEKEVDNISDSHIYGEEIDELGITVGERAAGRMQELSDVYDNLVEHGDMSEHEAVEYIMDRVQDRKIEYAASQMKEYDSIEDVEEALSV